MKKRILFCLLTLLLGIAPTLRAEQLYTQSFVDTPLDMLIDFYNEWTGRTLIGETDLTQKINLKFSKLTKQEAMEAIETKLSMSGIALVPMGEKFLKVVNIANARQEGMEIHAFDPDKKYAAADRLMSQVIPLRYVVYSDVQELVQHLIHGYGKVIKMDRINSILVTDTSANISQIVDAIALIDQPLEKIEPRIYQLKFAEAQSVAGKLKELVEAAKTEKSTQSVIAAPRSVPGVIRAPITKGTTSPTGDSYADETQIVQGEVKFVSDERTNILIIFSKAANFEFFDNIIKVLDVPVDPAVITEVVNLEYAKATEIASILNEFVGAAKETEKSKAPGAGAGEGSKTVDEVIERAATPTGREMIDDNKSSIGRLSEETKIISDERSNSLLLMGRKSDISALKSVIATLDVMLQQVTIEAVILSVGLNDSVQTGIQWVYQNVEGDGSVIYKKEIRDITTTTTTGTTVTPTVFEVPEYQDEDLSRTGFDAADLAENMVGGALSYYGSFPALNLEAIISAAKTDGDAKILSTPIVSTTDNTEASITVGEERPVVSSSINSGSGSYDSGYSARATYEYRNIGITLTVTPHINPQGLVVMEIKQTADDVGGEISIDGNQVPIISKREINGTVSVQDRSTIVLGGLIRKATSESTTKIPILGDIPLLGWFFSTHDNSEDRSELIVLLTPYVQNNPEQAQYEAERRLKATGASEIEWPTHWSESPLRNDEPDEDAEPEPQGFLKSIFHSANETDETSVEE